MTRSMTTYYLRNCLLVLVVASLSFVAYARDVIDIPSKGGPSTRTLYFGVPNAKATVLLFIGGDGQLKLTDDGRIGSRHTFVRSIERWASHGINAVLVDSPFDLGNAKKGHKRNSENHLTRVSEVISYSQGRQERSIWIFGHSMGTSTVAALLNSALPEVRKLRVLFCIQN